jgi:WD40 repeat protein
MHLLTIVLLAGSLWQTDSLGEFRQGEFKNISLTAQPAIQLAPELTSLTETRELLALCLTADPSGNLYVGTGSEGKVLRVEPGQNKPLLSLESGQVLSLASDKDGNVYAGTSPDGIIYRISAGKAEEFFETKQQYVWSLVFDDQGALYAGTGDSGRIYRITGKDKGEVYYDAPEPHIMTLVWQGALYAGSSGHGLVYRIKDKQAQVLYETGLQEVKGLVVEPSGVVYAAANPDPDKSGTDNRPQVFRILPDGNGTALFTCDDSMIFALARQDRRLLVATGSKARLYGVNTDSSAPDYGTGSILYESSEGQILALLVNPKDNASVVFCTGNSGKVYRLEGHFAKEGTFESRVFDTQTISHWGRAFWEADIPLGAGLAVTTRTGNSDKPDDTWSPWGALHGDQIASRPARYIQYSVRLSTADNASTPVLTRLTIAYAQTNLPPVIKTLSVKPSDEAGQHQDRVVSWDASDPNDDSLCVTIYVRGEQETGWIRIEKDKTGVTKYTVDSERLPDGWYLAKLVVSDQPSHPLGLALQTEKASARFLIDNTPPKVSDLAIAKTPVGTYRLTFTATDELSLIARCDVSTNLKDWQSLAPESGIFDSPNESFTTELTLKPGENVIVIRVQDDNGNLGTAKKIVTVE